MKVIENKNFNELQMKEIIWGRKSGLAVSIYADPKFNGDQMFEIRWGLEKGLDVSVYADPKFNADQMKQIRWGLYSNVDVSIYADPKFNDRQMFEIRWGLEKGLDVSVYAKPELSVEQMQQIRLGLYSNVDVSVYADPKFNGDQMFEIRWGLEDGLDVSIYADPKFNGDQMYELREGLEKDLDVSIYADPKFDWKQMQEIRLGLENGLDVSIYADPKFNDRQMQQIRWGLYSNVDVSIYADPKFNAAQMQEIREGLEKGLDVSSYANPELSVEQMKEIHHSMAVGYLFYPYSEEKIYYYDKSKMIEDYKESIDSMGAFGVKFYSEDAELLSKRSEIIVDEFGGRDDDGAAIEFSGFTVTAKELPLLKILNCGKDVILRAVDGTQYNIYNYFNSMADESTNKWPFESGMRITTTDSNESKEIRGTENVIEWFKQNNPSIIVDNPWLSNILDEKFNERFAKLHNSEHSPTVISDIKEKSSLFDRIKNHFTDLFHLNKAELSNQEFANRVDAVFDKVAEMDNENESSFDNDFDMTGE